MKKTDYQKQSPEQLEQALLDKREALRRFRFNVAGGKSTNVKAARELKKDIARIFTALHHHAK